MRRMGLDVRFAGTIPDDARMIEEATTRCIEGSDLVVTTGGASVGDYDFAVRTAKKIGAKILFWKVNMKPGGAILAATKDGKLLLSLSGNPAAALMILLVLAQPYLRRLCGQDAAPNEEIALPLKRPLPKTSTSLRLLRGHLEVKDGSALFAENEGRGNGNQASFDDCDLIGMVPADGGELPAGTMIRAIRLPHDVC
jgi:molybdopterin molybdotransferase